MSHGSDVREDSEVILKTEARKGDEHEHQHA